MSIRTQWNGWNNRGHDKTYHVAIIESAPGVFDVRTAYAARGATLNHGNVGLGFTSYAAAESAFDKQVRAKMSKSGYDTQSTIPGMRCQDVFASFAKAAAAPDPITTAAPVIPAAPARWGGKGPMLLNEIEEHQVEHYLSSPDWGLQEKKDGERRMGVVTVKDGAVTTCGVNKKGCLAMLPERVSEALVALGTSLHIDGEIIGDTLHCFNLLDRGGLDLSGKMFITAYRQLAKLLDGKTGTGLELVPLAETPDQKREMFEQIKARGGEGVVFIRLTSSYREGRPNSGGDILKFKFKGSASCVVVGSRSGKRSVEVGLYDGAELVSVGNVTIPANYEVPPQGAIVEISYLYVKNRGGSLFQPVYMGVRNDVDVEECTVGQLKYKDEPAVAA